MIPLIKKEFDSKQISLVVYCLAVVGFAWMYVGIFPSIQEQAAALSKSFESFGSIMKAFGVSDFGFDTLEKYLAVELFSITWPILVITFVAARAGQAISGEIEKGTMGLLLSMPIARVNIFISKYLAGLLALILFVMVSVFVIPMIASIYRISYDFSNFSSLFLLCLLFGWAIYGLGILLSSIFSEKGHTYVVLGSVLLLMYVANVLAQINDNLSWMQYGSWFHYYTASATLTTGAINTSSIIAFASSIVLFTVAGAVWFKRRDIAV